MQVPKSPYTFRPSEDVERIIEECRNKIHPERYNHQSKRLRYWELTEVINACVLFAHGYGMERVLMGERIEITEAASEIASDAENTEIRVTLEAPEVAEEATVVIRQVVVTQEPAWVSLGRGSGTKPIARKEPKEPKKERSWPKLVLVVTGVIVTAVLACTVYFIVK